MRVGDVVINLTVYHLILYDIGIHEN